MSLLADYEIAALCVPPSTMFDRAKYDRLVIEQNTRGWPASVHGTAALRQQFQNECTSVTTEEERAAFKPMISPFEDKSVRFNAAGEKVLSYGLSSYGYDARISDEFKIFTNLNYIEIDPKNFDSKCLVDGVIRTDSSTGSRYVVLPPNSYLLGLTVETFNLPRDVTALFIGKSTYARAGAIINCTPGEAGWSGRLVVEIGNLTTLPMRIYVDEGVTQALFFKGANQCIVSYGDRAGKYMNQTKLVLPLV